MTKGVYIRTNEIRKNISLGRKGIIVGPASEERKRKISLANKGKNRSPKSEETKRKMSLSHLGIPKGPFTLEHRRKISESRRGDKSWSWRGGISFEPYTFNFNEELKMIIRKRDNFRCNICNAPALDVHHIDYNKQNDNSTNLITLCRSCHAKTNFNRDKWVNYFKGVNL